MPADKFETVAAHLTAAILQSRVNADRSNIATKAPTVKDSVELYRQCLEELQRLYKK